MASIAKTLPRLYTWQFASVVLGMATQVLLARVLGPHDKGIIDLFILIPTVLSSITDFGLLPANTYFGAKKLFSVDKLHSNTILWVLALTFMAGAFCAVWILAGGRALTSLPNSFFLLAVLGTGPLLYVTLWGGLMLGSDRADAVYIVQALSAALQLAIYCLMFIFRTKVELAVYATAVVFLAKGIIALAFYVRRHEWNFQPDGKVLQASLKYGIALFAGIVVNIFHNRLIQFIVEAYLGLAALGWYAIAVRMVEMLWLLDYVVINASLFKLSSSTFEDSVRIATQLVRFVTVLVGSAALAAAVALPLVIPWLLGERFAPSVRPTLIMLPGIVAWSLGRSMAQFIAYQIGKPWYNTGVSVLAFAVNVVASVLIVPRLGIDGAAWSTTFSYSSMFVLMLFVFKRTAKVGIADIFRFQREDFVQFSGQVRLVFAAIRKPRGTQQ